MGARFVTFRSTFSCYLAGLIEGARMEWQTLWGGELEEQYARGEPLEDVVQPCQAVYIWRRSFKPPPGAIERAPIFKRWLEHCLRTPLALLENRKLTHYAELKSLVLGGQELSEGKQATLQACERSRASRRSLLRFVSSMNAFTPALYVGESKTLPQRVEEHLRGDTNLQEMLDKLGVTWPETELCYYVLTGNLDEDVDKSLRTLFEAIATNLTISGCVRRVG